MTAGRVSIIKLVVILLSLIAITVLQFMIFSNTGDIENTFIKSAHTRSLQTAIFTLVLVIITIGIFAFVISNSKTLLDKTPILVNVFLVLLTIALFASGVQSSIIASDLRCVKDNASTTNEKIKRAHTYATSCAVLGIVGAFLVLIIQAYLRINVNVAVLPQSKEQAIDFGRLQKQMYPRMNTPPQGLELARM